MERWCTIFLNSIAPTRPDNAQFHHRCCYGPSCCLSHVPACLTLKSSLLFSLQVLSSVNDGKDRSQELSDAQCRDNVTQCRTMVACIHFKRAGGDIQAARDTLVGTMALTVLESNLATCCRCYALYFGRAHSTSFPSRPLSNFLIGNHSTPTTESFLTQVQEN